MDTRQRFIVPAVVLVLFLTQDCLPVSAGDPIQAAGDWLQLVIPGAAGGVALAHRDGEGALQMGESLGVTLGATYGLKYTVSERRPNGGMHSFPSGHTSAAFSGAEFLRRRYGWEYGVPAYVAAAFTGYSRVESREHYPLDVLAGAGIGFLSSYFFTSSYDKGWNVSVQGGTKGASIGFNYRF